MIKAISVGNKISIVWVFICLVCVINPVVAQTPLTPQVVMDKVRDVDMGDNASSRVSMTVVNPKGDERTHELMSFRKKFGQGENEETRSIMFYIYPMSMKNVGYFSIDFKNSEKTDQHWMYTPTIQKMRRIGSKRLAIMNSDFSYADMSVHSANDYAYNSMKEDVLDGKKVWVIEGIPTGKDNEDDDDGYAKSIFYVRQDNYIVVRSINFLKRGNKIKQMDVTSLSQIDGIWVLGQVVMVTRKDSVELSRTIMKSSDVKFNRKFDENFFSQRQLTHGYE
ncbi:MAG TPA: outer membrane lipoprotein-sorting protein [Pseudomonadales bacterium]|nr:outer membrane lipoprotein-sorting protein [Pseudomonadales bacterium]